jgi:FMN-dependent NADH-azoreductase
MTDLLFINSSPRGEQSESLQIADELLTAYRAADPAADIDHLDLFGAGIPAFGATATAAKMDVFGGNDPQGERAEEWSRIGALAERIASARTLLFTVPMWNGSVPWALKQLIDSISQPGIAFSFDPVEGYTGLITGPRAIAIYTSAVWTPGAAPQFGVDFHSTYFRWWLSYIGITEIDEVRLQSSYPSPGFEERKAAAHAAAREIGRGLVAEPAGAAA